MANLMKDNNQLTEQEVLQLRRVRVPGSSRLQNNILKLTQELPQYTDQVVGAEVYNISSLFGAVSLNKTNFWNGFKPYAATLAAGFAVIALSTTLWMPIQQEQFVVGNFDELSDEQLAEELEWQDLMLLQDELAFAGL